MPKAILEFTLPGEQEEFETAIRAADRNFALHNYDNYLRSRLKYEELTEEVYNALELAREELHELLYKD